MTRSVLIDRTPLRTRAAYLVDDHVVRLASEFPSRQSPARTALYRVKVTSLDRRMNAAFCDMGNGVSGFLRRDGKLPPEGSILVAEVRREGTGDKGPDLTDRYTLRTPFATMRQGGAPRKGLFHSQAEEKDFQTLEALAAQVSGPGPLGLVDPRTPTMRAFLELAEAGVDELLVTSGELAAELDAVLEGALPISVIGVDEARRALDEAEEDGLARTVPLSGGGRLVVDQTEALTAIDLDLGSQGGQSRKGAGKNLLSEALSVLGRYAVLAGLGGQIVIDVPRGAVASPKILRDQITKAFRSLGRVSVPAVTPDGVCIVIAPKPEPTLLERLTVAQTGSIRAGRRLADDVVAARAFEAVEAALMKARTASIGLIAAPAISAFFAKGNEAYQYLNATYGPRFSVTMDPNLDPEVFDVTP